MNAQGALVFIVETLMSLFVLTYLLRFIAQLVRANFYNPLMQAIVNITNPIVMPLRRVIPGWGGADLASLFAAFFFEVLMIGLLFFISSGQVPEPLPLLLSGLLRLVDMTLMLYFFLILFGVIISWVQVDPRNPFVALIYQFIDPVLRPVRRLIPPIGGLDFSPFILLIGLQALRILLQ